MFRSRVSNITRKISSLMFCCILLAQLSVIWPIVRPDLVFGETSEALHFLSRCDGSERVLIAAVGDLIFQNEIQRQVLRPKASYGHIWRSVAPIMRHADIVYGNIEGPVADGFALDGKEIRPSHRRTDTSVYGTPSALLNFNYHPSLIDDLKRDGFRVVSTANNHALDRDADGVDRTIDNLERRGLVATGTRKQNDHSRSWSAVTEARGMRIAWLACTYGTNGRPDRFGQVLHCYAQREILLATIRDLTADPGIHATILVPHWGIENSDVVQSRQRELAGDAIAAGALAVIGTHPHVLQAWEKIVAPHDRAGLVIYSTGNFVSSQTRPEQRLGMIALIGLERLPGAGKAHLSAAGYILTEMRLRPRFHVVESTAAARIDGLPAGNRVSGTLPLRLPGDCQSSTGR